MRRKRQEMSEGTSQLDPARLKPEGKVSVVRKFSPPKVAWKWPWSERW